MEENLVEPARQQLSWPEKKSSSLILEAKSRSGGASPKPGRSIPNHNAPANLLKKGIN
jgi:hypothetical protein